jgi:hypothetical protein
LNGIVEIDETLILESFKGRRSGLSRPASKRGGKAKHPGLFFENIPVLVAHDCSGATIDGVLPEDTAACVAAALQGTVTSTNRLVCDGGSAIRAFARRRAIPLQSSPRRASQTKRRPLPTSTMSTRTMADWRIGRAVSTAWRPRTCTTILAGDAPSKSLGPN